MQYVCVLSLALFSLGLNREGIVYAVGINTFFLYFSHLDLRLSLGPLGAFLVGPQYHRLHHSLVRTGQDSNFAQVLPLWDWIGRTMRRPRSGSARRHFGRWLSW